MEVGTDGQLDPLGCSVSSRAEEFLDLFREVEARVRASAGAGGRAGHRRYYGIR